MYKDEIEIYTENWVKKNYDKADSNRGVLKINLGNLKEAIVDLDKAIESDCAIMKPNWC